MFEETFRTPFVPTMIRVRWVYLDVSPLLRYCAFEMISPLTLHVPDSTQRTPVPPFPYFQWLSAVEVCRPMKMFSLTVSSPPATCTTPIGCSEFWLPHPIQNSFETVAFAPAATTSEFEQEMLLPTRNLPPRAIVNADPLPRCRCDELFRPMLPVVVQWTLTFEKDATVKSDAAEVSVSVGTVSEAFVTAISQRLPAENPDPVR